MVRGRDSMEYYKKIRNIREDLDIKQYQFANLIHVLPKTYNLYENGGRSIPIDVLNRILKTLHLSLDYLLDLPEYFSYESLEELENLKDIDVKELALNLRKYRKKARFTQTEMAKLLNCSQQTLSEYERGNTMIPLGTLKRFCEEVKVSADIMAGRRKNSL